ncbi:MAG: flagellar basal-body rod protein FlgB [Planctomycetota bacterium]|jgi:flagellar basal-body rod protein FlgB
MEIKTSPSAQLTLDLMSASAQRARILAQNVANQNVPGYKRQDLLFESLLAKESARSNPDFSSIQAKVVTDETTPERGNGNNVSLEAERSKQEENSILFELYTAMMKGQMGLLRTAITGRRS